MRNINPSLAYYWGIIIPFERDYEHTEASNLVFTIYKIRWSILLMKVQLALIQKLEYHTEL